MSNQRSRLPARYRITIDWRWVMIALVVLMLAAGAYQYLQQRAVYAAIEARISDACRTTADAWGCAVQLSVALHGDGASQIVQCHQQTQADTSAFTRCLRDARAIP